MITTRTIDVTNVKKILKYCPYYDDIINYDIDYTDELSIDLIDWYKDLIFSCDGNKVVSGETSFEEIIKLIDKSMFLYVNSHEYRRGLKKIISIKDIDLNSDKKIKKLIKKILEYTNKYETLEVLNIEVNKWI